MKEYTKDNISNLTWQNSEIFEFIKEDGNGIIIEKNGPFSFVFNGNVKDEDREELKPLLDHLALMLENRFKEIM